MITLKTKKNLIESLHYACKLYQKFILVQLLMLHNYLIKNRKL